MQEKSFLGVNKMKDTLFLMLSLGDNFGIDSTTRADYAGNVFNTKILTEKKAWDEIVDFAKAKGFEALVINIGDAICYKSHPELHIEGGWTPEYMTQEVRRLRAMGFKVYPKLNFSAAHDAWLGIYGRMLGTPDYYEVVKDLIYEVCDIFETPELFHIGMDEEGEDSQRNLTFACYRQHELLIHDVQFMLQCVRDKGVRPWMWADTAWKDFDEFEKNIGKDVVVSPWYFGHMFPDVAAPLPDDAYDIEKRESYRKLTEAGYDIIPAGSIDAGYNIEHNIRFTLENAVSDKVQGFFMLPRRSTRDRHKFRIFAGIQAASTAKAKFLK